MSCIHRRSTRHTARFSLVSISLLAAFPALAFDELAALSTVIVTATRQTTRTNEVLSDVTVIDSEAIEQAGPTTLPELLSRQPGLHLVDNGGPGKPASVFMRGTSSGHTLLLVDGVPLGSVTSGSPSLQNLPLSQIERIEILRGPASSLYGSDAIGGVIQVFTRRGEGPARMHAYVGIGSRNTREAQAGVAGSSGPWSYSLAAAHFSTDGFSVAADPVRYEAVSYSAPNSDADGYRNTSYSGRVAYTLAPGHELGASVLEATSRNAYDGGGPLIDAYNNDKTRVFSVHLRSRFSDNWSSLLRWGRSEDNSTGFTSSRSQFVSTQRQLTWQHDIRLPLGSLMLALENTDQTVGGTTDYVLNKRTVRSLVAGYQGSIGAHSWQLSARNDDNSQFGAKTTGAASYGYRFADDWQARIAVGTAFKAPSFNQLYYPGYGDPTLQPELARNREVGLNWERGLQRASLTYFDNRISNMIASYPLANIGKARITGTSLSYAATYGAWSVDSGLDLMRPVDESNGNRLQRRPAQMLKLAATYAPGPWKAGAELTAIGRRYDSTIQTRAMGGYAIANLTASHQLEHDWALEGRINNLFDRVYENAWAYAVPDRQIFVGLRYTQK